MIRRPSLGIVVFSLAVLGVPVTAETAEHEELQRLIDRLESRLERLESDDDPWLSDSRAAAVRGLVADVVADASARTSLRGDDELAGYDDGFYLRSADGNYAMEVTGQIQLRYLWNRQDETDEFEHGFEMRRLKIKLNGHLFTPRLGYTIGTARNDSTNEFVLQSFNVRYRVTDELRIYLGRARPPLLREESVSSKRQLAVERSLVARAMRQTRTLGFLARYQTDNLRINAGLLDATPNALYTEQGWRASARVDLLIQGRWKDIQDFTSFPDDEFALFLGGGILYQDLDSDDSTTPDTTSLRWSLDIQAKFGGGNLFASVIANHGETEGAASTDQFAGVLQGGVFVLKEWEVFGRYEFGDDDTASADLSLVTVGVNHYIEEHAMKWTADVGFGLNEIVDFWATNGAGYRDDDPGDAGQVVGRLQFQLLF